MINPMMLFKLKGLWDRITSNHPKMVPFGRTVFPAAIDVGTIVDVKVTDPNGKTYHYNMRISEFFSILLRIFELFLQPCSDQKEPYPEESLPGYGSF